VDVKCCKSVLFLHVTTSKNVLAVVKILQNILAVSCLLPNIHEPASLQPITAFLWLTRRRAEQRHDFGGIAPTTFWPRERSPPSPHGVGAYADSGMVTIYAAKNSSLLRLLFVFFPVYFVYDNHSVSLSHETSC